jgi:hypothetical protein
VHGSGIEILIDGKKDRSGNGWLRAEVGLEAKSQIVEDPNFGSAAAQTESKDGS